MPVNPIFNPDGDDAIANRSVWFGNVTNLMQLNDVRYPWAVGLYQQMRENFWVKQVAQIKSLENGETLLSIFR